MKTQVIVVVCRYTKEGISPAQVIRDSFEAFLKKELQNIKMCLHFTR